MISSAFFLSTLKKNGFTFFSGIPCSILKDFLAYLNKNKDKISHIIVTSEGEALGIAAGYHLATSKIPVVYMQNSGLGNSIDSLTSLLNKEVYRIPVLLLISWRGEPGKRDEPQHIKMGKITTKLLKTLDVPYSILSNNQVEMEKEIRKAKRYFKKNSLPYAIIIRKGVIKPHPAKKERSTYPLAREGAIKIIIDNLKGDEIIISTTGKTTRELFEYREAKKQSHKADFYAVGSMGYSASIAFGIALQRPKKKVFVFDGDGSVLMQMGTLATIGHYLPKNFCHIIFDNNAHDSTGGQKTVSDSVDFRKVALACGYKNAKVIFTKKGLINFIKAIRLQKCPTLLVIKVRKGVRENLGRPTRTPQENKTMFMKFLQINYSSFKSK